jgi:nitrite reductase/ring-hydroxylating ferredoxin subunit
LNRREFIRTAVATTTLLAVGVTGVFEIAAKVGADQPAPQQQLQLPPISSETSQSSTTQVASESSSASRSSQASATSSQSSSASSQASTASSQSSSSSTQTSSASALAGYVLVAQLSSLNGKSSAYFTHPSHGSSILLSMNGQWRAFSAVCTHRPYTVEFQSSELYCPLHGATFSATNGSVTRGPVPTKLGEYGVIMQNGNVYVSNAIINCEQMCHADAFGSGRPRASASSRLPSHISPRLRRSTGRGAVRLGRVS